RRRHASDIEIAQQHGNRDHLAQVVCREQHRDHDEHTAVLEHRRQVKVHTDHDEEDRDEESVAERIQFRVHVLLGFQQADDTAGDEGTEDILGTDAFGEGREHDYQPEPAPDAVLHRSVRHLLEELRMVQDTPQEIEQYGEDDQYAHQPYRLAGIRIELGIEREHDHRHKIRNDR